MSIFSRVRQAWNAFFSRDPTQSSNNFLPSYPGYADGGYASRPDRYRLTALNSRSIVSSIYNRISVDVSLTTIEHVKTENGRYSEIVDDSLNNILNNEANIDQTGKAFIRNIVLTMLDDGCAAVVPVDASDDPAKTDTVKYYAMRVGKIKEWYPLYVRVELYNDRTGRKEEILVPKSITAIIENPFYSVMNEPNSTLQRLNRKLNLIDAIDENTASGKLDLILQLPYTIRSQARRDEAKNRRDDIENQLVNTKYGIAYIDGAEHITQLNRAVENNLPEEIQNLQNTLFAQLGMTMEILNGTADERTMKNYQKRTLEPILNAIVDELKVKFISRNARTRGETIMYFEDMFAFMSAADFSNVSNSLVRNEIATANELRAIIGWKPSKDAAADKLKNPNMAAKDDPSMVSQKDVNSQNGNETDLGAIP